jgi:hypothetical protein
MSHTRSLALLLLIVATCVLASCLGAEKDQEVSYDSKTDTFRLLKVYYHIQGSTPEELAYLAALYDNRREIIPADVLAILGESAWLRLNSKQLYALSLGEPKPKPAAPLEAPVDLSTLRNKPGHFFLTEAGTLAYYHQMEFPGVLIDALLERANLELNKSIADAVAAEVARRHAGGQRASWDNLRLELVNGQPASPPSPPAAADKPAETQPSLTENPWMCLDTQSIALLLNSTGARRPIISRAGSSFTASLELSEPDRRQLLVTWDTIKGAAVRRKESAKADRPLPPAESPEKAAKDQQEKRNSLLVNSLPELVKVTTGPANALSATADLMEFQALVDRVMEGAEFKALPEASHKNDYALTVEAAKAHGIQLDGQLRLQDMISRFRKGDLPVDDQLKVELGQGLFSPPK